MRKDCFQKLHKFILRGPCRGYHGLGVCGDLTLNHVTLLQHMKLPKSKPSEQGNTPKPSKNVKLGCC